MLPTYIKRKKVYFQIFIFLFLVLFGGQSWAQQQQSSDILKAYKRAKKFLHARSLVTHVIRGESWQNGDRLLYRDKLENGVQFMLANPANGTKKQAFNTQKLMAAISRVNGSNINASEFGGRFSPVRNLQLSNNDHTLIFSLRGKNTVVI